MFITRTNIFSSTLYILFKKYHYMFCYSCTYTVSPCFGRRQHQVFLKALKQIGMSATRFESKYVFSFSISNPLKIYKFISPLIMLYLLFFYFFNIYHILHLKNKANQQNHCKQLHVSIICKFWFNSNNILFNIYDIFDYAPTEIIT